MKRILLFLIILSVTGCAKSVSFESEPYAAKTTIITKSGCQNEDSVKAQRFTQDMLNDLIDASSFRGEYTVDTDTKGRSSGSTPSLYVVNFEEGGWMIVAGHVRNDNQVLAYSETGNFNPSQITNPGVLFWYNMTKEQMESVIIEDVEENGRSSQLRSLPYWIDMSQEYYWVRVPLPVTTEVLSQGYVAPLLNTKWGQGSPWNSRTPSPSSSSYCFTGCVAVSCAQILYYLQRGRNGFNIGLYDVSGSYSMDYNYNDGTYYVIDSSTISRTNFQLNSPKWQQMKKSAGVEGDADLVAELMFDIAEHAGMKFRSYGSGAILPASLFSYYNVQCDENDYNFNLVKSSLDRGLPVEVSCFTDSGNGHSWIIDGYKNFESRTEYAYQWRLIPPDSLNYYNNLDYDYVLTEEQKQFLHPDVEENQIDRNYTYHREQYLLMNWGWDGEYDDAHYSISANWTVGNATYRNNAKILHNFRQ